MLRSLRDLERYTVAATNGDVGAVKDFLFDDERWVVRHLVVAVDIFNGRRVLVSPAAVITADWSRQRFYLALTMDALRNSPNIDVDRPVSRQHERDYYDYYGYGYYWQNPGVWGLGALPSALASAPLTKPFHDTHEPSGDVHLRSAHEVHGYHVRGVDEAIGHVDDLIVDAETWEVRYLVVDTSNWWLGRKVVIPPQWARRVSWSEREVHVDMTRQAIKSSPEWDSSAGITRDYEVRLHNYFERPNYWDGVTHPAKSSPLHGGAGPR
ncbi:MAG: PRC-barrel domain-containing protein [Polyangiales bacterium]